MRSAIRPGTVLVTLAAVITAVAFAAPAAGARGLGTPPATDQFNSRCAPIAISPHAVTIGATITASAGARTDACGGPAKDVHWGWVLSQGVERQSGCGNDASSCVVKAVSATDAWTVGCLSGSSDFGPWESCDYYAVLGKDTFDLSGTLSHGPNSTKSTAGITVVLRGPGGAQSTRTDSHGTYTFAVKRGTYTVTPAGSTAPSQRTVSVSRDTNGVDFTLASDSLTLRFSPSSVPSDGTGHFTGSATVSNTSGTAQANQDVTFTPPLDVTPHALVCGRSGLVYPTLLNDGSALGSHFDVHTDANGVIPLSVWVGTQPGDWLLQGVESDDSSISDSVTLGFADRGSASFGPGQIAEQFGSAVGRTIGGGSGINLFSDFGAIGQSQASDQAVLLAFLRTVTSALPGADYGPVHAGGEAGIVFYRHGTADPLSSGVVMSIAQAASIVDAIGSGHPIPAADQSLMPLAAWASSHGVPAPADVLGSLSPPPQEKLLYFGFPYPPAVTSAPSQVAFYGPCLAPDPSLEVVQTHSPIRLSFRGAGGVTFGLGPGGARTGDGSGLIEHSGDLTTYVVPAGRYAVTVAAIGSGPATIVVLGPGTRAQRVQSLSVSVRRGQTGHLDLTGQGTAGPLAIAGRRVRAAGGLPLTVAGVPSRLRAGRRTTARLVITSLGAAVPGAVVVAGGHTAVADQHGVARLSLRPGTRGPVTLTVTSPGARALRRTITVTRLKRKD